MKKLITIILVLTSGLIFGQGATSALQRSILAAIQGTNSVIVTGGTVSISGGTISVPSSTVTTGNIGGFTALSSSTITMSVAGSYATGDYMGTSTTPQTFTNVCRTSGGTGIIKGIVASDKIVTANVAMELWLFSATFTAPTDNAAWAISDAEATTFIGVISLETSNWKATSNNQVYYDDAFSIPFDLPTGTTIYYALVARGTTPSFTSGDLSITLGILQD